MQVARDFLNQHPISIQQSSTVGDAVRLLSALDVRFLPVTDSHHRLVGTITDRELWRIWEKAAGADPKQALDLPLGLFMNRELLTLDPDADLAEIVDLMIDHNAPMVPVIDHSSLLIGVISYAEVLRNMSIG